MWRDQSGYFYNNPINGASPWSPIINLNSSYTRKETAFLNEGGTIVSTPTGFIGVSPCADLPKVDPFFNDYLVQNNYSYYDGLTKLSEKWTTLDYIDFRSRFSSYSKTHSNFIITYGTDNVSFFAPWVDLLCKEFNVKAVVIIAQRSWDRPTSEFIPLVQDSPNVLKKLCLGNAVVLSHNGDQTIIHNPYEIRKSHTTSKRGFYSTHNIRYTNLHKIKPLYFRGTPLRTVDNITKVHATQAQVDTPFSSTSPDILLCRGVGNSRSKPGKLHSTIVGSGPTCEYLYGGHSTVQLMNREVDFTWESLYVINHLTNYENRD